MNSFRTIFAALALTGVTGCATTTMVHNSKNAQDFERDKYDCKLVAQQSAANWGSPGNVFMIVSEMQQCLKLKHGWTEQQ